MMRSRRRWRTRRPKRGPRVDPPRRIRTHPSAASRPVSACRIPASEPSLATGSRPWPRAALAATIAIALVSAGSPHQPAAGPSLNIADILTSSVARISNIGPLRIVPSASTPQPQLRPVQHVVHPPAKQALQVKRHPRTSSPPPPTYTAAAASIRPAQAASPYKASVSVPRSRIPNEPTIGSCITFIRHERQSNRPVRRTWPRLIPERLRNRTLNHRLANARRDRIPTCRTPVGADGQRGRWIRAGREPAPDGNRQELV